MSDIETIIILILLLMAVPDLCRLLGRPALANAVFVMFGLCLGPILPLETGDMLKQAGKVGFLLVLFEVGLEIDLPRLRDFLPHLKFAIGWGIVQIPLVIGLAMVAGLNLPEATLAAAALTGCSVSMAYYGWKQYPGLSDPAREFLLQAMVALEVLAIITLAVGSVAIERGFSWMIPVRLVGIAAVVFLIGRFASHLVKAFQIILEQTTHWRVHILVLLVLVVCALGERLGLSAAKTAFFLGLFMSRARHDGMSIEEYIAPISRRFLIPIFFVSLGLLVDWRMLFTQTALLALCGAFVLMGYRQAIHERWLKTGGDRNAYLLLCPNLTMVALAATSLLHSENREAATWVTLSGLFLSVASLMFLPRNKNGEDKPAPVPAA